MSLIRSEKWYNEVEQRVWSPVILAHGDRFSANPEEEDHVYNVFWEGNPKIATMERGIRSVSERLRGAV